MDEPEVKLGENILVPDPAGWKKEGLPDLPEQENRISVSPDWVCEVLSPATVRTDRVLKMPVNAKFGVASAWLIDPTFKTLEAFRLESGKWVLLAAHSENDKVRTEPFHEIVAVIDNVEVIRRILEHLGLRLANARPTPKAHSPPGLPRTTQYLVGFSS